MRHLAIVLAAVLLAGCAGPMRQLLPDRTEKVMNQLDAQCFREHAPRSYWESEIIDEFAVAHACHLWARRQVLGTH